MTNKIDAANARKDIEAMRDENVRLREALEIIETDFIDGEENRGISAKGILEICEKALEGGK